MPAIKIQQNHNKPYDEMVSLIEDVRAKLEDRYDIDSEWNGDYQVDFDRTGLDGSLSFDDDSVEVNINLSFVLGAFKGKIEAEINNMLQRKLG